MYDIRVNERPCRTLYYSAKSSPTCIDWLDDLNICVGFSDGALGVVNMQTPGVLQNKVVAHKKAINKVLTVNKTGIVASASDDFHVQVHKIGHESTLYSNSDHTDYVQDLVFWQGEECRL